MQFAAATTVFWMCLWYYVDISPLSFLGLHEMNYILRGRAGWGLKPPIQRTLTNYAGLLERCPELKGMQQSICEPWLDLVHAKAGKLVAKLVAIPPERPRLKLGSAKGEFVVSGDFNDPLTEIEDLFW
jgi:hypothetical protein